MRIEYVLHFLFSEIEKRFLMAAKKGGRKKKKGGLFGRMKTAVKKGAKGVVKAAKVGAAAAELTGRVMNPINQATFLIGGIGGEGWLLPGSKYIGPGNRMNKGKPRSAADAAALQHDKDYDEMIKSGIKPSKVYTRFSDADQRLMNRSDITTADGLATYVGMAGKKALYKLGLTGKKLKG